MRENLKAREEELLNKAGRRGGWQVPEGYFESLAEQIRPQLPELEVAAARPVARAFWQRMSPYIYLAAMFCGIWLMMQIFHWASEDTANVNIDNPPAMIAQIMEKPEQAGIYVAPSMMQDMELESEMVEDYADIDDFEAAFEAAGEQDAE